MLLGMSLAVYVLTCIFDGFNIRRRILSGETVPDGIHDVLGSIFSNKKLTTALIVIILILVVVHVLGFVASLVSNFLPIIIIGAGLYILFRKKQSRQ